MQIYVLKVINNIIGSQDGIRTRSESYSVAYYFDITSPTP